MPLQRHAFCLLVRDLVHLIHPPQGVLLLHSDEVLKREEERERRERRNQGRGEREERERRKEREREKEREEKREEEEKREDLFERDGAVAAIEMEKSDLRIHAQKLRHVSIVG